MVLISSYNFYHTKCEPKGFLMPYEQLYDATFQVI